MKRVLSHVIALLGSLALLSCASTPRQEEAPTEPDEKIEKAVELPYEQPDPVAEQLDSEIIFSTLAGEIATQRGDFDTAYDYQLEAALLTGDPKAAERAARLAIFRKETEQALTAALLWVELAPNDLSARQLTALLSLRKGETDQAYEQLQAVVAISQAKGEDGFLHAMAALGREAEPDGALALMRRLSEAHKEDPRAAYAFALTALTAKRFDVANQEVDALIANHPDWERGYLLKSRILVTKGEKVSARSVLEGALAKYPGQKLVRLAYARLLVDLGESQKAYEQFSYLRRQMPEDSGVLFSLGVLAIELERFTEARKALGELLDLNKRVDEANFYLGRIEEILDRNQEAIAQFEKVKQGALAYEARVRSARLHAVEGHLEQARDLIQGLRIRFPKRAVPLYLVEIDLVREYGNQEQVMPLFDTALKAHPEDADLLYARGLYAASIDRLDILEQDMRTVIKQDPANADALNALGYTLADRTQRYSEALELISRALKLRPETAAIMDSMGWVQYRLGNFKMALDYLRKAMDKLPDSEIAAHLGEVLWVTGEREEARRVWNDALKRDPDSRYILETQGRLDK